MSDLEHQKQHKQPTGESLEQTRHNYSVQAQMAESDDNTYAGVMIKPNQQGGAVSGNKKEGRSINDLLMMNDTFQSLAAMENMMVEKYGEDFDLYLAAEFLDDETYKKIASIQDIDQRREAVSKAIQEGIEEGTIDPKAVENLNPEFMDWVEERVEHRQGREFALEQKPENNATMTQDSSLEQNAMAAFGPPPSSLG